MSLMVQSIMLPLNLFDSPVMKKYILGSTTSSTGGRLYNELDSKPTIQSLAPAVTAAEVPRVEELPDEPTADAAAATSKTSLANDK